MLDIDIEAVRGILFVRLNGVLDRQNTFKLNNEVTQLLKKIGIKNIVFNIDGLESIDKYGVKALRNSFKICQNNQGRSFLCTSKHETTLDKIKELKEVELVSDELAAANMINS